MENEKDMGTVVSDYAIENFKNGLNCAESVMDALVRSGALKDSPEIVGLCTGFGGGIGLAGYTCGALSAAVMANSAVYGRPEPWKVDAEVRGSEIAENRLMEGLPEHMTYPDIQPVLLQRVQQWLEEGNYRPLLEDLFEQFY